MEPWYSGAVVDAVREAKSRRALFIVYVRDDSEQSQSMDELWSNVWSKINNTSTMIALRLNKDTEACTQFIAIYKVQTYPTIYLINGQNGQVLKIIDQAIENSNKLQEIIEDSLNIIEPKQQQTTVQPSKTVDEKVAEARARLKELHDKREEEIKEKEKDDELNRRRLGQQMILDKQKKAEELLRKQAEELRRDKLEQQKLQEKLKAQIQQDREEKRQKYEQEQISLTQQSSKPKITTIDNETPKINYTRSRLQFRLTDGSFFTEDFSPDAHMNDVYQYLQETLPIDQYRNGSYILRTIHTRMTLTRDNPNTLKELELVPSAVLLVVNRGNINSPSTSLSPANIFQSIPLIFTWLMMQFNFIYQFIFRKLFGNRTQTSSREKQTRPTTRINNTKEQKTTKKENFRIDSTEKSTIRRFHNTQDDSDDEEKRTWNGNSTQQM
jgi:hypothetical protein